MDDLGEARDLVGLGGPAALRESELAGRSVRTGDDQLGDRLGHDGVVGDPHHLLEGSRSDRVVLEEGPLHHVVPLLGHVADLLVGRDDRTGDRPMDLGHALAVVDHLEGEVDDRVDAELVGGRLTGLDLVDGLGQEGRAVVERDRHGAGVGRGRTGLAVADVDQATTDEDPVDGAVVVAGGDLLGLLGLGAHRVQVVRDHLGRREVHGLTEVVDLGQDALAALLDQDHEDRLLRATAAPVADDLHLGHDAQLVEDLLDRQDHVRVGEAVGREDLHDRLGREVDVDLSEDRLGRADQRGQAVEVDLVLVAHRLDVEHLVARDADDLVEVDDLDVADEGRLPGLDHQGQSQTTAVAGLVPALDADAVDRKDLSELVRTDLLQDGGLAHCYIPEPLSRVTHFA